MGAATAQSPIAMGFSAPRYRTRYVVKGYESLEDLNQIMTDIEAPILKDTMHFKTQYMSIMLSWLMNDNNHSIFENYGCHCDLATIFENKPFVGYTKSNSGAKDEIDWFCAQHKTCHACLDLQSNSNWNGF